MILKRKMYDKLLTLKNELNGKKAFLIICIPPYMTICL